MRERFADGPTPSRARRILTRIGVLLASFVLTGRFFAGETPTTLRRRDRRTLAKELSLFGVAVLAGLYVHFGLPAGIKSFLATVVAVIGGFTAAPFAVQYVAAKCAKQMEYPGSEFYAVREWLAGLWTERK